MCRIQNASRPSLGTWTGASAVMVLMFAATGWAQSRQPGSQRAYPRSPSPSRLSSRFAPTASNPYSGFGAGGTRRPVAGRSPAGPTRLGEIGRSSFSIAQENKAERANAIQQLLFRPSSLLYSKAFSAPIRRFDTRPAVGNILQAPAQADVERALEELRNREGARPTTHYADDLQVRIASQRNTLLQKAWHDLRNGDYARAYNRFESVEIVDRQSPEPRFGQLLAVFVDDQLTRSMHKLAKIFAYNEARRPNVQGMFDYELTLLILFPDDEEELQDKYVELRGYVRALSGSDAGVQAQSQALLAFMLWYSGFDGDVVEAMMIAGRIQRQFPRTPWAKFYPMMVEARQRYLERPRAAEQQTEEAEAMAAVESTPPG